MTYDAVVVGSGATGGWAAMHLAESGLDVLVLEAGPPVDPAIDFDASGWSRERREARAAAQPVQSRHGAYWRLNPELFVDDREHPYTCPEGRPFAWIRARRVGGRSNLWGGLAPRLSPYEMETRSRRGYGEDWPMSAAELAPHYARVERFFGVQGTVERLPQLPDGEFVAPHPMTPGEVAFKRAVEAGMPGARVTIARCMVGPGPAAVDRVPVVSSVGTTLRRALATGRVTLRPDAIASHLILDRESRATAVACIDRVSRAAFEARGRVFVLCASTIESTRVLLHSVDARHPGGVANPSGLLGQNLMDHLAVWIAGTSPEHAGDLMPFGGPDSIYIPRFADLDAPSAASRGGYAVWGGVQRDVGPTSGEARSSFLLLTSGEILPSRENTVTLDRDVVDAWGLPAPRIDFRLGDEDVALGREAKRTLHEMARLAGLTVTGESESPLEPGLFVHEVGTARMGRDPRTSCLDPHNAAWDARNVFVTDGACWPTAAYQNPTLTMLAVTARCCDHIVDQLRRGELS